MEIVASGLVGPGAGLVNKDARRQAVGRSLLWCDIFVDALDAGYSYAQAQALAEEFSILDLAPESNPPGERLAA